MATAADTVVLEEEIDPNYVPTESEVVEIWIKILICFGLQEKG